MNTTALRLRKLREAKELSQEECAKLLGIDRTTYAKYENGGSIKRNIDKLANFFNVSTDYLFGNDTSTPTPANEASEDAALLELLRKDDPEMQKILKNVHIDGTFTDGKRVCDLSPESIIRIKDAIRVSFAIDGQKGRAVVEIDE